MTLTDFKTAMIENKYSKDYVQKIDKKMYFFDFFNSNFYDITDYVDNPSTITHSSLERHINDKVDVINFIRDIREDFGDDGGFCMYTGMYQGKYILGSNYISYNLDFSENFINKNILEPGDENIEFKLFNSLNELNQYIESFIYNIQELNLECENWSEEDEYLDEDDFEDKFMYYCLNNLGLAFYEFQDENIEKMESLTDANKYTKRIHDPVEFISAWVEDEDVKPLEI